MDPSSQLYKQERAVRKYGRGYRNRCRSILRDACFVDAVLLRFPNDIPILLNERTGSWYYPYPNGTCYFKSTDGHPGTYDFSFTRLNLHVATLASKKNGLVIVDASQSYKAYPDSLSRTIPIWAAILNIIVFNIDTETALSLPSFITKNEKQTIIECIERKLKEIPDELKQCILDVLHTILIKPLKCIYYSQKELLEEDELDNEFFSTSTTYLEKNLALYLLKKTSTETSIQYFAKTWSSIHTQCRGTLLHTLLNDHDDYFQKISTMSQLNVKNISTSTYTPIYLLSVSKPCRTNADIDANQHGWDYIPGAADDPETWSFSNITPNNFWKSILPTILQCKTDEECELILSDIHSIIDSHDTIKKHLPSIHSSDTYITWGDCTVKVYCQTDAIPHEIDTTFSIFIQGTFLQDDIKAELSRWTSLCHTFVNEKNTHSGKYIVPANNATVAVCKNLFQSYILPDLISRFNAIKQKNTMVLPVITYNSGESAPSAALLIAALLLYKEENISKARMRTCLAKVQVVLQLGSIAQGLEKQLWKFLSDEQRVGIDHRSTIEKI